VIGGTILTDEQAPRPVSRVLVSLFNGERRGQYYAISDPQGRFQVPALPAGRYTLYANRPGYLPSYYGATKPWRGPSVPISLADGQQVTDLTLKMNWGAAITGTIRDASGQPMSGIRVQIMEPRTINGERVLSPVSSSSSATDDRGVYRVYAVPPGTYVVGASATMTAGARLTGAGEVEWAQRQITGTNAAGPIGVGASAAAPELGQTVGYGPVFYPGTPDTASAVSVTVRAGEERTGIDFAVQFVPTARIEGVVTRGDGQPVTNPQIFLLSNSSSMGFSPFFFESPLGMRPQIQPNGRFAFPGVRPGDYSVLVRASSRAPAPGARPAPGPLVMDLWASASVRVDGRDISGLPLTLEPGMNLTGRIAFEAKTLEPPTDLSRVSVNLRVPPTPGAVSLGVPSAQVAADGTFRMEGSAPGKYLMSAGVPNPPGTPPYGGWMLKSATVAGQDVSDTLLEIRPNQNVSDVVLTFTDQITEIGGRLVDGANRPAPEYFVFVFPTNRSFWFQGSRRMRPPTRPANDGGFRVLGLPPGEYYVAALTEFDQNDLYDASFLEQLIPAAFKITLAEGEKRTQDLRIAGGKE